MSYQRTYVDSLFTYLMLSEKRQLAASYVHRLTLSIIIGLAILFSSAAASTEITNDKTPSDDQTDEKPEPGITDSVPPVQAGPGGSITLKTKDVAKAEALFEWNTHVMWESRYVSEGRDNLSGDSIASLSSELIVGDINFIPWYAISPEADYEELNLNFLYGVRPLEVLAVYIGYIHLRAHYQGENAQDNEISLGLVYKLAKKYVMAASAYHSFEADGAFIEVTAKYFDKIDKGINYSVRGGLGINTGYVPDGHKGFNNLELRANASYLPFIHTEIYAYTAYNIAIGRDAEKYTGDELLGDFLWAGIGFIYLF